MNLTYDALPGEWQDAPPDDVDLVPAIGGCGNALVTAAKLLVRGTDAATPHLEVCPDCREALVRIGTIAGGIDALLYFERQMADTETSHAAELAGTAA